MTAFHRPSRHRSFLPGHSLRPSTSGELPSVDADERRAKRARWNQQNARRFDRSEISSRYGMAAAIALFALVLLSVLGTPGNALERAQQIQAEADAEIVTVDEAPPARTS